MPKGVAPTPFYGGPGVKGMTKRARLELTRSSLWSERSSHEAHWRDCADFIKPRRPRFLITDRNKGDRRNQKIIDSTGSFAARTLQSGLHAGMTNPARPWLKLLTPDPELNEFAPVKEWLHTVTQRMLTVFARTNLYNVLPIHYGDIGTFATGATGIMEDSQDVFRAYSYPIGSYAIGTNERGVVDQWVREWTMSVYEIVERYLVDRSSNMIDWTNASTTLKNLWDQGQFSQQVPVCWVVEPNVNRDDSKLYSKYLPYYSCVFEKGSDEDDLFLQEKGYNEFPVLVSRWDVTGEDYWGTDCPAMIALGDVKQLQHGERKGAQAVEKMVNPPLQAPQSVRNQKASLLPGDITYHDAREGMKGITPIHETTLAIDQLDNKQERCRMRIRTAFYEDLFLMLAYSDPTSGVQPKTATEIVERKEEKLIALGPVLERSNDELHDPLVDRTYAMMDRKGMIPPPPEEMIGMALKVEYVSILAQAQKLVGVAGLERFLSGATQLMAVAPQVKHKINFLQAIDDYNDTLGNNPKLVFSDEEAKAGADRENAALQAQASADAALKATGAVKNLAQAPTGQDSVLDSMAENLGA